MHGSWEGAPPGQLTRGTLHACGAQQVTLGEGGDGRSDGVGLPQPPFWVTELCCPGMAEQLPAAGRGDGTPGFASLARADCALHIELSSSQPTGFLIFHSSDSLPIPPGGTERAAARC